MILKYLVIWGSSGNICKSTEKNLINKIQLLQVTSIATDKVVDNGVDYAIEQAKDLSSKLSDSWFLVS